jgi:hypothetical protein
MRPAQRLVLAIGIIVFLGLALFPPYLSYTHGTIPGNGFRSIFSPSVVEKPGPTATPDPKKPFLTDEELDMIETGRPTPIQTTYRINYQLLTMMLFVVAVVTGAGVFLFKR